jgi:predicted nucleotidyltransferase component of viral defense system
MAASVKHRLLHLAKQRNEDFGFLLTRYAAERLLYRIGRSKYARDLVLKGATLFQLRRQQLSHRATRDVDLLGRGAPEPTRLERIFREIIEVRVGDDGLLFLEKSVRAESIREGDEYAGIRVRLEARLGAARIQLQVDVGFGDALITRPKREALATLLDLPSPRLLVYPWEAVIAEKFHIMVELGMGNSRMKDYFDVHHLSQTLSFAGRTLADAIEATFDRRRTPLPPGVPIGLSAAFAEDAGKRAQWRAFMRRLDAGDSGMPLDDVVDRLRAFLMPPVEALRQKRDFRRHWAPGGPWRWTRPPSPDTISRAGSPRRYTGEDEGNGGGGRGGAVEETAER